MTKNPFITETFIKTWCNHFYDSKLPNGFQFIKDIVFVKHAFFPYYVNIGKNLTNGITCNLQDDVYDDFKGKTFLIRDLPTYQNFDKPKGKRLKLKKVSQYQGYITQVKKYDSLDHYLKTIYKSNSRSKLRRNVSRLEACFKVDYTMYHGHISETEFENVFDTFYKLLEKRYSDKGEPCGELDPLIWNYYCDLAYKMINEKTASLFVIYCDDLPIGVTFSYHFGNILIEALTVFDIDYYRFNIGHTTILKMLEWSFENGIEIFDYTQGDFDYKKRWSDETYDTYYYILYDSKSLKSILTAGFLQNYFYLKRFLRDKKFNEKYHHIKHKLFPRYAANHMSSESFSVEVMTDSIPDFETLEPIDFYSDYYNSERRALYDFLYMNPERASFLKIYEKDGIYYVSGKKQAFKIYKND
ncbi:GNAT family N-acetyltransferase [Hanstruepera neustonica]|uniref:GNAT family N-acetyltransferase n=1 Tax=Hanstruepera neustonica TaxID=1445657 RepID=A0A2K1DYB9_9FLAO|nr:GNAT family N-acetyltransferase [Hanstruepera neustonica]PNQ73021.1 GNAT family N-acetyltransferase [Hanstruepera neustonica]